MIQFDVLNRWAGEVQFTASIDCAESAGRSLKLGLAVLWGLKNGADLSGADLRGAYLGGADLGGLILLARATRSDGYEYFAWTSVLGGMVITAGCRTWLDGSALNAGGAIRDAREHCETVTADRHRAEALRIVDFIEAGLTAHREVS